MQSIPLACHRAGSGRPVAWTSCCDPWTPFHMLMWIIGLKCHLWNCMASFGMPGNAGLALIMEDPCLRLVLHSMAFFSVQAPGWHRDLSRIWSRPGAIAHRCSHRLKSLKNVVLTFSTSFRALGLLGLATDQPPDHIFRMEHSADVVGKYEGAPRTFC